MLLTRFFWLAVVAAFAVFAVATLFWPNRFNSPSSESQLPFDVVKPESSPKCQSLPGASDVLVVMKTGATEAHLKLPVHFETTFQCIQHYVIYSTLNETIAGHPIYDVLADVPDEFKQEKPEFELYNKLHNTLDPYALEALESDTDYQHGWDLDKWKFLPMMDKAYLHKPDAKWYIFIEADTAIVWSNLLSWLAHFDSSAPHFLGGQNWIGKWTFGHGGSGLFVSNAAVQQYVEYRGTHRIALDELTADEWAGDLVFTMALNFAGVKFQGAWPIVQGEKPATQDYARGDMSLCFPVGTYHHVLGAEIRSVWEMEQKWITNNPNQTLRLIDMYDRRVRPHLADKVAGWDNLANEWEETDALSQESFDGCRAACEKRPKCKQFKYNAALRLCKTSPSIQMGHAHMSLDSGWMLDRIKQWRDDLPECPPAGRWILPKNEPRPGVALKRRPHGASVA